MAMANDLQTLNGLFKDIYSDKGVVNLIPESLVLLNRIPFSKKEQMLGAEYVQPVVLG